MATRILYVDIDDTLVRSFGSKQIPMTHAVEMVRALAEEGTEMYCWSSGGADYARATAAGLGLADCFRAFLPKPQALLDDCSFDTWRVREIHPNECHSGIEAMREKLQS
jgi:phosphoglycolate phosphatase-like HAD superfamily hydrolase